MTPAANGVSHLAESYRSKARGNLQDRYATGPTKVEKWCRFVADGLFFLLWKKSDNMSVIFS